MSRKDTKFYDGNEHIFYSDDGSSNVYLRAGQGQTLVVEGSGTGGGDLVGDITSVGVDTSYAGIVPITKGGTGQASVTPIPIANGYAGYDDNSNIIANNFLQLTSTIATSGGTTTLTVASPGTFRFTGTNTQDVVMPVTSTLLIGQSWKIYNKSTGIISILSSGLDLIVDIDSNSQNVITCISLSGTTAASWLTENISSGGTSVLTDGNIFVGNVSNVATSVSMSGDATIDNTGVLTLATTNAAPGTTTLSSITTNEKGLVTSNDSANLEGDITSVGLVTTYEGIVPVVKGGTGVSSISSVPSPNSYAAYDVNSNLQANNFLEFFVTTPTSGSTTTLTVASARQQYFTGTTFHFVRMPAPSTCSIGQSWKIKNLSTGGTVVVLASNGISTVTIIQTGSQNVITCILASGVTASSWSFDVYPSVSTLNSSNIFVGNVSNVATGVALSGDATLANTGALTLNTVNATVGSFGSSSLIPQVTVNAKGLVTSVGTTQLTPVGASLASNKFWIGSGGAAAVSSYSMPSSATTNGLLYSASTTSVGFLSSGVSKSFYGNASGVPTFADQSLLQDGDELLPTYSFASAPSSGMWYDFGIASLGFSTEGTQRILIESGGDITMHSTTPASDTNYSLKLDGGLSVKKNLWVGFDYADTNTTDAGVFLNIPASTYTTTTTGTIPKLSVVSVKQNILGSSGSSTITAASTVHISGPPTAGAGVTLTKAHSLYVESGNSLFGGTMETYNGGFKIARYQATTSQSLTATVDTKVLFPTTVTNEIVGLSYSSGNFTCSQNNMRVVVTYSLKCTGATSSEKYSYIMVNATGVVYAQQGEINIGGSQRMSSSTILELASGDVFSLWILSTVNDTISTNSSFNASSIQIYTLPK